MRKFIGIVATLCLIFAMSLTAFAAKGNWSLDGETWSFIDSEGNKITNEWQKSGDKIYYLNEEGVLAKNEVVEKDDNYYYVGEDGSMCTSLWVFTKINEDDEAAHWMYFANTGKAYKDGWKEIAGNKYHFTDAQMDYGFLDANGVKIDEDDEEAYKTAVYYCGKEEDGRMRKSEWVKVNSFDAEKGYVWLYFNNGGKKLANCVKEINGIKYGFNTEGAMVLNWAQGATAATSSNDFASASNYYEENNGLLKKVWYYGLKGDDSEEGWYYFDGKGEAYKSVVKKIDGYYYGFDATGKMLMGFVKVDDEGNVLSDATAAMDVKKSDIDGYTGNYMYFLETDDGRYAGQAAQGKVILEICDGEIKCNFSKAKGIGKADGVKNENGYLYYNSVLRTADEDHKYEKLTFNNTDYLVNQAGKICKKGTYKDSLNKVKWTVDENGVITGPVAY